MLLKVKGDYSMFSHNFVKHFGVRKIQLKGQNFVSVGWFERLEFGVVQGKKRF